ncbi:MAG: UPF0758 domain-containing protein [Patescibacteria group bacterium]
MKKDKLRASKTKDGKLVSWRHPGGKLLRLGAESLSDEELVAILIGTGIPGKSAVEIAKDLFGRFQSFRGMASQSLDEFKKIKGLSTVKVTKIAATFEIARRIVNQVLEEKNV